MSSTLEVSSRRAMPEAQDLYRVVVLRKRGSHLLVVGDRPPYKLPAVEIPRWERVAENLVDALRKRYGIPAICLFTPEPSSATTDGTKALYQVMEARGGDDITAENIHWLAIDLISSQTFAEKLDAVVIERIRRDISEFHQEEARRPFVRPGWVEGLFSWAQHEVEPYGLRLTGEFRQLNASPTFSLLRLETNGQALWFKAVGEPNLREFPISIAMSDLFPGFVPTVVATHRAWHGWLTLEFTGSTLGKAPDVLAWKRTAQTLAELQISSIIKTDQLLGAGCRDLRVAYLLALVDPFLEAMSQYMGQQKKIPPAILNRKELQTLGTQVKDALSAWARLNIPDTIGHLDFNPGNILVSTDQCVFLDWAEGYVGPPFLTIQYLREHHTRLRRQDVGSDATIVRAYEAYWHQILSPQAVSAAMDLAPLLAVFSYAAGTESWRNPTVVGAPAAAAYLRSLLRRTHLEVQKLLERRALCTS